MTFKLEASVKANESILVRKYRSEATGLSVIVADVDGPVINGYFTLATEAHDDDGLPHTLEHLIFLGSELYPYKGVLDLIANRCLASGTNAWTDTDHTCYTMTTAGSDGFLSLLPIYLDHILYPTLTDAGFITEVHHISGEGEDGGVVYCEMQGRENTGESRVHLEMLRAIYPGSGYSAETGGIMKNLRESTTNEKVRAYHAKFYRPDNLTVIVAGKVEPEDVFKALASVEERIVAKGKLPTFEKPWMSPVAPLAESKNIKILYASDEEDCGIVNVAYRGPHARSEHRELTACSLLMRYLADTSVSPLQRDLVETSDPHASKISYNIGENSESVLYFSFENVPVEKIDKVFEKYCSVLLSIAEGREKIDMKRLGTVIDKAVLEALSSLEANPQEDIAYHSIGYILYGETEADFDERLNTTRQYRALRDKNENFWLDLLRKYFIDAKYVVVRAVPSIAENQRVAKEELERIEKQRNDLGEEGLALKEQELTNAMLANEITPPNEMITQIQVPSVDKISFHGLRVFKRTEPESPPGLDLKDLPVYAEAYDLNSNFVNMILSLNTESVPVELRPYLLILLELFTESPIFREGKLIPYEEVVAELEADTVTTGTRIGLEQNSRFSCGPFSSTISILIQVEPQKYAKGAKWLAEILNQTQFTVSRIKVTAAKMANDVAQAKRNGNATTRALLKAIYYKEGTNAQLVSLVRQFKFLSHILESLDKPEAAAKIVEDLNRVREIISSGKNVGLHISANWQKLAKLGFDLVAPWKTLVTDAGTYEVPNELRTVPDFELINAGGNIGGSSGVILGLGSVESAFLFHAAPAISDFNDPDLPALMLFLQYLLQLEGPLWRQIRGGGLAYGYSITPRPNEGLLYMSLYRATNVAGAYRETKNIVEAQLQDNAAWDETLLESARSSLIFEVIEREKSVGDVVVQALLYTFKDTSVDYNKTLVQKINSVKEEELVKVGQKYVAPLFSSKARTSIVCHPDKCADIKATFEQIGHTLRIEPSLEESVLA